MTFRDDIVNPREECLVFGADNHAQFTMPAKPLPSKCDRALPCAAESDVVVLDHPLDPDYQRWLRDLSLGTEHVVSLVPDRPHQRLGEMIADNPAPVRAAIEKTGRHPVFVPWYSGSQETRASRALSAPLFGARTDLSRAYNDKARFKALCRELGVNAVPETVVDIRGGKGPCLEQVFQTARSLLSSGGRVLFRAVVDNTGLSMAYPSDGNDIAKLFDTWTAIGIDRVLVEPLLSTQFSPGDQWLVTRKGKMIHKGMREQVLQGLWHRGNIKTPAPPAFDFKAIKAASAVLVQRMADEGYVGILGFDYIQSDGRVYPVECNARFNGSTYPMMIVERVEAVAGNVACWKALKVTAPPCSFAELARRVKPILFDGHAPHGFFPYNCEALSQTGSFCTLLMGKDLDTLSEIEAIMNAAGIC